VIKAQKGKKKDPSPDTERTDRMNPVELETNPANDDVSRSLLGAMTKAASATAPATTDESDDPDEDETHPVDAHSGLDSADSSTDKSSDSELEDIYMSQDSSSDDGPSTHEENLRRIRRARRHTSSWAQRLKQAKVADYVNSDSDESDREKFARKHKKDTSRASAEKEEELLILSMRNGSNRNSSYKEPTLSMLLAQIVIKSLGTDISREVRMAVGPWTQRSPGRRSR
jgi:hypothetical protein